MILSALAVQFINTPQSRRMAQQQLTSTYTVFDIDDDSSTGENLARSLVNTLVIVSVICAMTFLIVLLYKFRCMKLLLGYMILSSTVLFFFLGRFIFTVTIQKYRVPFDIFSYFFSHYNSAPVETIAICHLYGKGISTFIIHAYLVATSAILVWQILHFDDVGAVWFV
mmetsp:Transcript_25815/g.38359  ORF Transcript_25815/g.38359 Transcript_25815/m.38359 type:complete len:168 (-) Transcript_25815:1130-1633(-)